MKFNRRETVKPLVLNSNELIVLAAVLGGSNMGMPLPTRERVQRLLDNPTGLNSAVLYLWQNYMDSDETHAAFLTECRWWLNNKSNLNKGKSDAANPAYVKKVWPHIAKVMGW